MNGEEALDILGEHLRQVVVSFFDVPDLGKYMCCSSRSNADADNDAVWAGMFNTTRRPRSSLSSEVQAQVARPFGAEALGFEVSVFYAELNACFPGIVKAYRSSTNAYLIKYAEPRPSPDSEEVWEHEARTDSAVRSNPMLASRCRISFLSPASAGPPAQEPTSAAGGAPVEVARESRPLCFGTWREELRHVAAHTPSKIAARLKDHSDEVLFATFSPCGGRLATCSRDCTTRIYDFGEDGCPTQQAILQHDSAVVRAQWCPDELLPNHIAISTDGPSPPTAEVWQTDAGICLLRVASPVRDVYASVVRWPTGEPVLLASGSLNLNEGYVQELRVYALPAKGSPGVPSVGRPRSVPPLARLVLRGALNYFHCLEPAPPQGPKGCMAALSATQPRQCDIVALVDLPSKSDLESQRGGEQSQSAVFELNTKQRVLPNFAVLSARWAQCGRLLMVNARARVESGFALPQRGETVMQALQRPAPPLRTNIELLVLDATTLDTLSTLSGHHAFTSAEAPFIVHADAWADAEFVASGAEDACVHIWHRSHGRKLQCLQAHSMAINAVTWSHKHRLLVSASDDHTAIVWS